MSPLLDPSRHRVLLVGPRVVAMRALFNERGFPTISASLGVEGMAHLDTAPFDLVLLELDLGDLTATEFLMAARQGHQRTAFLLLDDATRAAQIVKTMQAGFDGFVAQPTESERLFFEVERHLSRLEPPPMPEPVESTNLRQPGQSILDAVGTSSFDVATKTAMNTLADDAGMRAHADLVAELAATRETLNSKAAEVATLTADVAHLTADIERHQSDVARYAEVQAVLAGQLEAPLDGNEAMRLRERLGLAQVAEIELMTLRSEVQSQKTKVDTLTRERDEARRDARMAADAIPVVDEDSLAREQELRSDLERAERRAKDLEHTLTAAKEALQSAQRRADDALKSAQEDADEELETAVLEAKANARADAEAASQKLTELEDKAAAQEQEIVRLQSQLDAQTKKLNDTEAALAALQESAPKQLEDAVRTERVRLEKEQKTALEMAMQAATLAETDKAKAALAALRAEYDAKLKEAEARALSSKERADDIELQLEEARTRTEFLESDQARVEQDAATRVENTERDAAERIERIEKDAEQRVHDAEAAFKKEKLRLVEEKQAAAAGSQEAAIKVERYRDEMYAAKRTAEDLEKRLAEAEARARGTVKS